MRSSRPGFPCHGQCSRTIPVRRSRAVLAAAPRESTRARMVHPVSALPVTRGCGPRAATWKVGVLPIAGNIAGRRHDVRLVGRRGAWLSSPFSFRRRLRGRVTGAGLPAAPSAESSLASSEERKRSCRNGAWTGHRRPRPVLPRPGVALACVDAAPFRTLPVGRGGKPHAITQYFRTAGLSAVRTMGERTPSCYPIVGGSAPPPSPILLSSPPLPPLARRHPTRRAPLVCLARFFTARRPIAIAPLRRVRCCEHAATESPEWRRRAR